MTHLLETWGSFFRTKKRKVSGFIKRGPHRGKHTYLERFFSINIHRFTLRRSTTWTNSRLPQPHQVSRRPVRRKKRQLDGENCAIEDDLSMIRCLSWAQYTSSFPISAIKCMLYLRLLICHNYEPGEYVRYGCYVAYFLMMLIAADFDGNLRLSPPQRQCVVDF